MKFDPNKLFTPEQIAAMSDEEREEFMETCSRNIAFEDADIVHRAGTMHHFLGAAVAFTLGLIRLGRTDLAQHLTEYAQHLMQKAISESEAQRKKTLSDAPPVTGEASNSPVQSNDEEVWAEVIDIPEDQ